MITIPNKPAKIISPIGKKKQELKLKYKNSKTVLFYSRLYHYHNEWRFVTTEIYINSAGYHSALKLPRKRPQRYV